MRISFLPAHVHLIFACTCTPFLELRMRISFDIRVRILFWLRMRIYFLLVHAHLILACACAPHLVLRMRISFWPAHGLRIFPAHAHRILTCTCAPHLHLRVRNLFCPAHSLSFCRRMSFSFCVAYVHIISPFPLA